ncbi:MAG: HIT family hydrolase [Omnitrophica WOR_2 bacterium RIFCSPHIGHO2_02_FULL_52_10]|nr:MAG: HIT family hydrolase [Omnitrophica WOR_2 bacterium RIFCSPHIGHO2_02_FULL_52_10]
MASLFTKIVKGEIPCHKICEDAQYLAFLDIRPIHPGHTLVIPKKEVDYLFDVDDATLGGMMVFAKKVARAIEKEVECKRIGVMVAGLEVPHAHIHLIPIRAIADLNFAKAKPTGNDELAAMAEKIRRRL